jgi:hypothetical protein
MVYSDLCNERAMFDFSEKLPKSCVDALMQSAFAFGRLVLVRLLVRFLGAASSVSRSGIH